MEDEGSRETPLVRIPRRSPLVGLFVLLNRRKRREKRKESFLSPAKKSPHRLPISKLPQAPFSSLLRLFFSSSIVFLPALFFLGLGCAVCFLSACTFIFIFPGGLWFFGVLNGPLLLPLPLSPPSPSLFIQGDFFSWSTFVSPLVVCYTLKRYFIVTGEEEREPPIVFNLILPTGFENIPFYLSVSFLFTNISIITSQHHDATRFDSCYSFTTPSFFIDERSTSHRHITSNRFEAQRLEWIVSRGCLRG